MDWQTASRIMLEDGKILSCCDQCRQTHGERNPPTTPPCESCRVELRDENRDVGRIYMETRGQVITAGMGEIIDINILAVAKLMDLYGIRDQLNVLRKIRSVFHHFLSKMKDKP